MMNVHEHWEHHLDDIEEWKLLDYETNKGAEYNEMETEPIVEEQGGGARGGGGGEDLINVEKNTKEVESTRIHVDKIFGNEEGAYDAYNL